MQKLLMPTYQGPVNTHRRQCLLEYGKTLPQQDAIYTIQCFDDPGYYCNLNLTGFYIRARNRAEAVAIWLDYQNKHLECRVPYDSYDMMVNIPEGEEDDSDEELVKKYVQYMFDNEYLQMNERTLCLEMM